MNESRLILPEKIDRSRLLPENYLISLVYAAIDTGIYTEDEMIEMQTFAVMELEKKVHAYTRGESTSVRTELAERFMESLFYTAGVTLMLLPTPEDAVEKLKSVSFSSLCEEGLREIRRRCQAMASLATNLRAQRIPTQAVYYRYATEKLIPAFLRRYNAQFLAQENEVLPDYPLLSPVKSGLTGILFMQRYLQRLYMETQVLRIFSAAAIERLLASANPQYRDTPENILRPVLLSALGAIVAGGEGDFLCASELPRLAEVLFDRTEGEIEALLSRAVETLFSRRSIAAPKTVAYLLSAVPGIAAETAQAVKNGTLARLYPTPDGRKTAKMRFRFGQRMDDDAFSVLLFDLSRAGTFEEKNAIIRERVHSLYDLEDLLAEGIFAEDEGMALLSILNEGELAFLLKKHPALTPAEEIGMKEGEIFLSRLVARYLSSLPSGAAETVARLALHIDDAVFEE